MDIRTRRRRSRKRMRVWTRLGSFFLVLLLVVLLIMKICELGPFSTEYVERTDSLVEETRPDIDVQLLTYNEYSRPGGASEKIKDIVIHYTANPGTTAEGNRSYFEGLKDSKERRASSHFVVGLEGEIVQCVPTWEIAYASNSRNRDTVSIETCHPSADGTYTKATYRSLVELTAWLCLKFNLTEDHVIRHYDVTGKICPKYFVENEKAWKKFKRDVGKQLDTLKE